MAQEQHIDPTNRTTWANQDTHFTNLAILRARMQAGQIIFKSDMLLLNNLIHDYLGHYHTYQDLVQRADSGNNGDRDTYVETRNSGVPSYGLNTSGVEQFIPDFRTAAASYINAPGNRIANQVTNIFANQVRSLRTHTHVIFDKIAR
jgi:hypothetical protein